MGGQETKQVDEFNGVDSSLSKDEDLTKQRRKHMTSTESSAHNRKAAIVPMEVYALEEQGHLPLSAPGIAPCTLPLSSRELVVEAQWAASALVVHPDTNLILSSLTPCPSPSTVTPTIPSVVHSSSSSSQAAQTDHSPKACTTSHTKSSSRDIGIVGTRRESPRELATVSQDTSSDLKPPIFQTPASRSPSAHISVSTDTSDSDSSAQYSTSNVSHAPPSAIPASVEPMHSVSPVINGLTGYTQPRSAPSIITSSRYQGISIPEQGQVSPSSASSMSATPSSYLYYQPGIHSKAGPLPPPPRAMFDIDFNAPPPPRPPRLRSPSPLTAKRGPVESTTSTSVTLRLASKTSVTSIHHQIQISSSPPSNDESSSWSSSQGSVYSPE